jgi:hypothetical protein
VKKLRTIVDPDNPTGNQDTLLVCLWQGRLGDVWIIEKIYSVFLSQE